MPDSTNVEAKPSIADLDLEIVRLTIQLGANQNLSSSLFGGGNVEIIKQTKADLARAKRLRRKLARE